MHRIIKAIDELGDKIQLDDDTGRVRLVSNTTAVEVWNLSKVKDDVIIGLELRLDGGEPVPVLESKDLFSLFENGSPTYTETDAAIFLSGEFVRMIINGECLFLFCINNFDGKHRIGKYCTELFENGSQTYREQMLNLYCSSGEFDRMVQNGDCLLVWCKVWYIESRVLCMLNCCLLRTGENGVCSTFYSRTPVELHF